MKILSILETPYRGTIEEQDDAALWLTHAVKNASGHEFSVLLRGNAVNYATRSQDPTGLVIGGVPITRPCKPQNDLSAMSRAGISVFAVREDLAELGIAPDAIITDIELVARSRVPALVEQQDQVWHW